MKLVALLVCILKEYWVPVACGLGVVIGTLGLCYGIGSTPDYQTVVIDGCQYIKNTWSSEAPLVHKANCPNHHE